MNHLDIQKLFMEWNEPLPQKFEELPLFSPHPIGWDRLFLSTNCLSLWLQHWQSLELQTNVWLRCDSSHKTVFRIESHRLWVRNYHWCFQQKHHSLLEDMKSWQLAPKVQWQWDRHCFSCPRTKKHWCCHTQVSTQWNCKEGDHLLLWLNFMSFSIILVHFTNSWNQLFFQNSHFYIFKIKTNIIVNFLWNNKSFILVFCDWKNNQERIFTFHEFFAYLFSNIKKK